MTAPDPRLGEIEARLSAATPGPWTATQDFIDGGVPDNSMTLNGGERGDYIGTIALRYDSREDAEFIAHAPTDLAYLLAELRSAREVLAMVGAIYPIRNVTGPAATFAAGFNDALKRIRAAVAAADPHTDPEGVALVEAIIERKAQDNDRG